MLLASLDCTDTLVADLRPLADLHLRELGCSYKPYRDRSVLKAMASLERINQLTTARFWQQAEAEQVAFDAWCKQVAALPVVDRPKAVHAKLKELNRGHPDYMSFRTDKDGVTAINITDDNVADLSPLRALPRLQSLTCFGQHRLDAALPTCRRWRGCR